MLRSLVVVALLQALAAPSNLQVFTNANDPSLDKTAPTVTITSPTSSATYDNGVETSVTLAGTAVDDGGTAICAYSNSLGTSSNATTAGSGAWSAVVALAVGDNVVTVTCTDRGSNSGTDAITVTVAASGGGVPVGPSDSIQSIINANPAGTTYTLTAGTHRHSPFTPKTGDTFQGQMSGSTRLTTLSGADVLTSWTADSGRWYVTGQTSELTEGPSQDCESTHPRCVKPEDVWFTCLGTTTLKKHESTLGATGAGEWFFDYVANRIYVGDDPTSCTVETSRRQVVYSIGASTTGVTLKNIIVEKYASSTGGTNLSGAVNLGSSGIGSTGWIADGVEGRWNHYAAIGGDTGSIVRNSYLHHNCNSAIIAAGSGVLVEDTEIAYNNVVPGGTDPSTQTCGFEPYWGAGGTKFVFTTGLIVQRVDSHHNRGQGLWTDIENYTCRFTENTITDNTRSGIFHEISHSCEIDNNVLENNGLDAQFGFYPTNGCIEVNSSDGRTNATGSSGSVNIHDNICRNNLNGIIIHDDPRNTSADFDGAGTTYPIALFVANVTVQNNRTIQTTALSNSGGLIAGFVDDEGDGYTGAGNSYANNTYCIQTGALLSTPFAWGGANRSVAAWQAQGQDVGSNFADCEDSEITYISGAAGSDYSGASSTSVAASAITGVAGNHYVAVVRWDTNGVGAPTVSNTAGDTWTQVPSCSPVARSASEQLAMFYAQNINGNASDIVTATWGSGVSFKSIVVVQHSGLSPSGSLDDCATDEDGVTPTCTTDSFTTNSADQVIIAAFEQASIFDTWSAGGSATLRQTDAENVLGVQSQVVASIQTNQTASMTTTTAFGSVNCAGIVATFR